MAAKKLSDTVKIFIVRRLACFDTPSEVAEAVKEEFGIEISKQSVHGYDPTSQAGKELSQRWTVLFKHPPK